jgi:hypothetical protein
MMTPTQAVIFKVLNSCFPDGMDTADLLERTRIPNRNTLKVHVYHLRKQGVKIVGSRGGAKYGGYRLEQKPFTALKEPPTFFGQVRCHHNTVWVWTSEHERMATPGECCREILKSWAKIEYFKHMLMNLGQSETAMEQIAKMLDKKFSTATEESEIKGKTRE